jgi:threonine/homoserine/homoserine lactone efflux protein
MLDILMDILCWFGVFYLIFHFFRLVRLLTRMFTTRQAGRWRKPYQAEDKDA